MQKFESNPNGTYKPVLDACAEFNLSRNTLMKMANEADAVFRMGSRIVRINMPRLRQFMDERCGC